MNKANNMVLPTGLNQRKNSTTTVNKKYSSPKARNKIIPLINSLR